MTQEPSPQTLHPPTGVSWHVNTVGAGVTGGVAIVAGGGVGACVGFGVTGGATTGVGDGVGAGEGDPTIGNTCLLIPYIGRHVLLYFGSTVSVE